MPFGRGSCWRAVGPGIIPVGGIGPKCFVAKGRIWPGDLLRGGALLGECADMEGKW